MPELPRICTALAATAALLLPAAASAQDAAAPTPEPAEPEPAQPAPPPAAYPAAQPAQPAQPAPVMIQSPTAPPGVVYVDAYGRPVVYGPPPPRPPRPPRVTRVGTLIGVNVGFTAVEHSAFNDTAALWGYSGFHFAPAVSLQALASLGPFFMLGGRLGYLWAGGGAAGPDFAPMSANAVDLGVIARAGIPLRLRETAVFFPALQLEAGAAQGTISLRNESQGSLLPRLAANLVLLFSSKYVGVSLRGGYQWMRWSNAGGDGVDLSFSGWSLAAGLEVRL